MVNVISNSIKGSRYFHQLEIFSSLLSTGWPQERIRMRSKLEDLWVDGLHVWTPLIYMYDHLLFKFASCLSINCLKWLSHYIKWSLLNTSTNLLITPRVRVSGYTLTHCLVYSASIWIVIQSKRSIFYQPQSWFKCTNYVLSISFYNFSTFFKPRPVRLSV